MYLNKDKFNSYICFFFITLIISYAVSLRDLNNVADTFNYANNFLEKTTLNFKYEVLFDLLTFGVRFFTDNYIFYFFIINLVLNFFVFNVLSVFSHIFFLNRVYFLILSFCIFIFSSWYYVAAFNGLRQGLALVLFYYASVSYFKHNNKLKSFTLMLCSCFFHYSNFLILPFLIFLKLKLNKVFLFVNIFGVLYFFGVNEIIVKNLSTLFGLPIYDSVKYYTEEFGDASYRYGFQWDLFIYTMGLAYFYFFLNKYFLKDFLYLSEIIKIFYVLILPYFVFGFASYSNRYGIMAWFFSVFINSLITYLLIKREGNELFKFSFVFLFILSIIIFFYKFF